MVCQGDGWSVWVLVSITILVSYHTSACSDILYLKTVHYVHTICMTNHLWPAAVVYGEIALPGFRQYYGQHSKVVGALLVR